MDYWASLVPPLWQGCLQTLKIFLLTLAFSLPLGLPIALGSTSRFLPIKWLCQAYVWVFRGTPLMLQLFFFFFALPILSPALTFNRFTAVIITFVLNYAAYFSEIYRSGIQSIDSGQYEAAHSMAYSRWQTMRLIILPQMLGRIVPPVSNETITLVKDTALATVIAVPELIKNAKDAVNRDQRVEALIIAAAFYLAFTFILTVVSQQLEKHFSRFEKGAG